MHHFKLAFQNRNCRKIAAFSNRTVQNRKFCCKKTAERSPENRKYRRHIAVLFQGREVREPVRGSPRKIFHRGKITGTNDFADLSRKIMWSGGGGAN